MGLIPQNKPLSRRRSVIEGLSPSLSSYCGPPCTRHSARYKPEHTLCYVAAKGSRLQTNTSAAACRVVKRGWARSRAAWRDGVGRYWIRKGRVRHGRRGNRRGSVQEVAFELRIEGGEGASSKGRFQVKNTPNSGNGKGQGQVKSSWPV